MLHTKVMCAGQVALRFNDEQTLLGMPRPVLLFSEFFATSTLKCLKVFAISSALFTFSSSLERALLLANTTCGTYL